jgi:hypothetical protein
MKPPIELFVRRDIEVDLAECDALAEHVKAEIERIVAASKKCIS